MGYTVIHLTQTVEVHRNKAFGRVEPSKPSHRAKVTAPWKRHGVIPWRGSPAKVSHFVAVLGLTSTRGSNLSSTEMCQADTNSNDAILLRYYRTNHWRADLHRLQADRSHILSVRRPLLYKSRILRTPALRLNEDRIRQNGSFPLKSPPVPAHGIAQPCETITTSSRPCLRRRLEQ